MELCVEYGYTSLNKVGEELCGDRVEVVERDGVTTMVLADGMGSGVKANILSTLTSKILCTMVAKGASIEECLETIIQSLPVCKVRGVAYSTFSIIHINSLGEGVLIEFDNPQAIYFSKGKALDLERNKLQILGKTVYESKLLIKPSDFLFLISDGTIHAGVGKVLNFGWQRKEIMEFLEHNIKGDMSARSVACMLASACNDLYLDKPGDDTTVAAMRLRPRQTVSLMVGPPVNKDEDDMVVEEFLSRGGKKVVCGGTSAQIVARTTSKNLRTSFEFPDREIPPIGFIDGIDLTTEGVITLRRLLELSEKYLSTNDLTPKTFRKRDGASLLAQILFEEATEVHFFVGQGVNAAHKSLPIDMTMKLKLIDSLSNNLRSMGKNVTIKYN